MSKKEIPEVAPFNMAMLFYIELHELRSMKSKAFINGDLIGYRDCLEEIFNSISFKITNNEKQEIIKLFQKAEENDKTKIKLNLRTIDMKLQEIMHTHKMIFPNIEVGDSILKTLNKFGIKKYDK